MRQKPRSSNLPGSYANISVLCHALYEASNSERASRKFDQKSHYFRLRTDQHHMLSLCGTDNSRIKDAPSPNVVKQEPDTTSMVQLELYNIQRKLLLYTKQITKPSNSFHNLRAGSSFIPEPDSLRSCSNLEGGNWCMSNSLRDSV